MFFLAFCRFAVVSCMLIHSSFVMHPTFCCVYVFVSEDGEAHDFGSEVVRFQVSITRKGMVRFQKPERVWFC